MESEFVTYIKLHNFVWLRKSNYLISIIALTSGAITFRVASLFA